MQAPLRAGRRAPVARRLAALTSGAALAVTLTACSSDPVTAKPADRAQTPACQKASTAWPHTVADLEPYPVTTPSKAVRAWGKDAGSAVIARCGVTSPGPTTDSCFSADDVDWVRHHLADGDSYVTYGRDPAIEVLIPTSARLDGTTLAAFAPAAKQIAQGEHRCS